MTTKTTIFLSQLGSFYVSGKPKNTICLCFMLRLQPTTFRCLPQTLESYSWHRLWRNPAGGCKWTIVITQQQEH